MWWKSWLWWCDHHDNEENFRFWWIPDILMTKRKKNIFPTIMICVYYWQNDAIRTMMSMINDYLCPLDASHILHDDCPQAVRSMKTYFVVCIFSNIFCWGFLPWKFCIFLSCHIWHFLLRLNSDSTFNITVSALQLSFSLCRGFRVHFHQKQPKFQGKLCDVQIF